LATHAAVDRLSLDIYRNEFFASSALRCGKTTLRACWQGSRPDGAGLCLAAAKSSRRRLIGAVNMMFQATLCSPPHRRRQHRLG
jgi:hypothetical protein